MVCIAKNISQRNTKFGGKVQYGPYYLDTRRDPHRPNGGTVAQGFMFWSIPHDCKLYRDNSFSPPMIPWSLPNNIV